ACAGRRWDRRRAPSRSDDRDSRRSHCRGGTSGVRAGARGRARDGHDWIDGYPRDRGDARPLFYTAAGGRAVQMSYTGPRLYLGSGVTTIRTTGSRAPYAEINLKDQIDRGLTPGPRIHLHAPYITGPQGAGTIGVLSSPGAPR